MGVIAKEAYVRAESFCGPEALGKAICYCIDAGDLQSAEQINMSFKNPVYVIGGTAPQYRDSQDLITVVSQKEQGITDFSNERPVLATFGLGPCIALTGYDSDRRAGFLTHYDSKVDLSGSLDSLFNSLPHDTFFDFDVSIIGGDFLSASVYLELKSLLSSLDSPSIKLSVSEEDVFGEFNRSVALDTRTGRRFVYRPDPSKYFELRFPDYNIVKCTAETICNSFAKHE